MKESITLRRSIAIDGKEVNEIELDLDGLTGADMAEAEREYLMSGGVPTNLNTSVFYLQHVAARACGLDIDSVARMSAQDSTYLTTRTQHFLLDLELPSASERSESFVSK